MSHPEYTIKVQTYGMKISKDDCDDLWEVYNEGDIAQYFSDTVVALVHNQEGEIIGGMTESNGDELAIAVAAEWQQQGIGTAVVKAFLEARGGGFMVAGTEAGLSFLVSLPSNLGYFPEALDVPCWEDLQGFEEESA